MNRRGFIGLLSAALGLAAIPKIKPKSRIERIADRIKAKSGAHYTSELFAKERERFTQHMLQKAHVDERPVSDEEKVCELVEIKMKDAGEAARQWIVKDWLRGYTRWQS